MRLRQRGLALAALAAAAGLLISSCGAGGRPSGPSGGSDEGITATSIKIGAHFPLTGVAAPGYSEIPTGAKAYFDYINANGGVNGRKIDYIYRDDAYNPTNTSQVVNQLVLQDKVFGVLGGLGTPTHSAVLDFLNSEHVPDLFVSSGSRLWNQPKTDPYTFGWQTDYEVEGKILGQYIHDHMPNAKVGLFLQDDDFGADGEKGVRQYINNQIVAAQRYVPTNTDVAPQISALQAAGADVVISFSVPSFTALSQLAALKINYHPQWVLTNVGSDPALVGSLLGKLSQGQVSDASLLNGVITSEYEAGVQDQNNPWTQLWQQVWAKNGIQGQPLTNYRIYGMSEAYTFVQALQAAGPNPTRDGIVKALEKVGGKLQGPAFVPYRYSANSHAGMGGVKITRIQGTGLEDLSPVFVTDNDSAPINQETQPQAAPPPNGIPNVPPAQ
jgi:branched-chain amino acid transport system substrate-binding protein